MDKSNLLVKLIKSISVEPMLLFFSFAIMLHSTIFRYGLYNTICVQMTGVQCAYMGINDTLNRTHSDLETKAQKATASFQTIMAIAYVIPAFFADMLLGAWGDRKGRKHNILLGTVGWIILIIPTIILYKYPESTPLYILLIGNIVAGVTGFFTIILISSFAYISDTVADREMLTVRMAVLQAMVNLGQVLGPLLASALSVLMELAYQECVVLGIVVVSFVAGCILLKQVPPAEMRKLATGENKEPEKSSPQLETKLDDIHEAAMTPQLITRNGKVNLAMDHLAIHDPPTQVQPKHCIIKELILEIAHLLKAIWHTYTKKRPGNARAYLLTLSAVLFVVFLAETGIRYGVLSLYLQKAPLNWNQAMLGYYDAAHGAAVTFGTLFGTFFMKRFCHLDDSTLILISIFSCTAEVLLIAFGTETWMIFVSTILGSLSFVVKPGCKSFVAKLVEVDEVGKAYTVFGIAQNVAALFSNVFYNNVYKATLHSFPGCVFVISAIIFALMFAVVLCLHIDNKRNGDKIQ